MKRMTKQLTCTKRDFCMNNYGNFFFKDKEGNQYHWYTSSDKAYEQLEVGTTKEIRFNAVEFTDSFGEKTMIMKNARWN